MNYFDNRSRPALSLVVAAVILAGCGGLQPPIGATGAMANGSYPALHNKHSQMFSFTGAKQTFIVPTGVTQITVVARGASGPYGAVSGSCIVTSGLGGLVKATIPVTPGETLAVFVGGEGALGAACYGEYGRGRGGFNGGGNGGRSSYSDNGDGGGGASDVRQNGSALSNRILVAGGGGGQGGYDLGNNGVGGAGGGRRGGAGSIGGFGHCPVSQVGEGGGGGTQQRGGAGGEGAPYYGGYEAGRPGHHGVVGAGGRGGRGGQSLHYYRTPGGGGGGGGGGYYGGGGGGGGGGGEDGCPGGGGGGGSAYIEAGATNLKDKRGAAPPGNGQITISW
jgi:hypothetical protein